MLLNGHNKTNRKREKQNKRTRKTKVGLPNNDLHHHEKSVSSQWWTLLRWFHFLLPELRLKRTNVWPWIEEENIDSTEMGANIFRGKELIIPFIQLFTSLISNNSSRSVFPEWSTIRYSFLKTQSQKLPRLALHCTRIRRINWRRKWAKKVNNTYKTVLLNTIYITQVAQTR